MVRDTKILDYLSGLTREQFSATVYRATSQNLDPIAPSAAGGRWMFPNSMAVLYTSIERDGALAELSFYLGMLTPLPSKPMVIHALEVEAKKIIRITRKDFAPLGIDESRFADIFYEQTQLVGDAAGFLGCDGLLEHASINARYVLMWDLGFRSVDYGMWDLLEFDRPAAGARTLRRHRSAGSGGDAPLGKGCRPTLSTIASIV